jgi:hypothetical protein
VKSNAVQQEQTERAENGFSASSACREPVEGRPPVQILKNQNHENHPHIQPPRGRARWRGWARPAGLCKYLIVNAPKTPKLEHLTWSS